jgi:TolB protein
MRKALVAVGVVISTLAAAAPASAVAPGDNGKLLYTLQSGGNFDIWTVNADGSGNTPIITDALNDQGGSWSPDGAKIVFRSTRTGAGDIYIANADGTNQVRLTTDPASEAHPSFSPDGTRIVFVRGAPDSEIFVMDTDPSTADAQNLTNNTVAELAPEWSPDGTRIAYFLDAGNVIAVMNADGSDQHVLDPGLRSNGPQWSPDARRVLFNRSDGMGDADPHAINADGTGLVNLGQEIPISQAPSWSPDGSKIVTLAGSTESDIWILNPDGSGAVKILDDTLVRSGPRWQPVPRAPTALTDAPTDVTTASAKLNGRIDSNLLHPTTYFFEYGTTTAYGARTGDAAAPSPLGPQAVSAGIGDLLPFTTYHARLVARNAIGTTVGPDQTFRTAALPPLVTTGRATATQTTAALFGIVDPRGAPTEFRFEYGTDTSYGSATSPGAAAPGAAAEVTGGASGLKANTLYHYRLVATNPGNVTTGADATVRTLRKAAPRSLSAAAKPRRDRKLPFRYRFSGRLRLPAGLRAAEACNGSVLIQVHRGRRRVTSTRAGLSRSCSYRKVVSFRNTRRLRAGKGRLKVSVSFRGNASLATKRARTLFVSFG